MKKQVHEASQVQGSKAHFAEVTVGIQITVLIKMANAFKLFINDLTTEVCITRRDGASAQLMINIKADATGKGKLTFTNQQFHKAAELHTTVFRLGGVYAYIDPKESSLMPGFEFLDLLVALNTAILTYRDKYGEPNGQ